MWPSLMSVRHGGSALVQVRHGPLAFKLSQYLQGAYGCTVSRPSPGMRATGLVVRCRQATVAVRPTVFTIFARYASCGVQGRKESMVHEAEKPCQANRRPPS